MGTSAVNISRRWVEPKTEFFLFLTLLTAFAAVAGQITFSTGAPDLTKSGSDVVPMTEQAYAAFSEQMKNNPRMVVIKKKPTDLGPDALYGYNFVVNGTNRGWILERSRTFSDELMAGPNTRWMRKTYSRSRFVV
jgi:hypothetical protein